MSKTMRASLATALSALVLVGGLVLAGVSLAHKKSEPAAPQSLLIHYIQSWRNSDGVLEPVGYYIRAVHSSGIWKETRYSFNGSRSVVASDEDGLYVRRGDEEAKQLYAQTDPQVQNRYRTAADYINSPQFVRTETLLGRTVYVISTKTGENDQYSELSFGLDVGGGGTTPLRIVAFDGDQVLFRMDPVAIEVRGLSEAEVRLPAHLPVKTDVLKQRAEGSRQRGQNAIAEGLERLINQPRQK
ncbi:MAG: hypothetical protein AABN34_21385 [Acidobacteriota bacterium]